MPDTQDLNQIEYRHHPTRDLSPVASSMSPQSRSAWHAQIRAWVRQPHDERLSESACYQVFPNGTAALAWRYRDGRAAERSDGSRGRPLVSRVLAGPASVLSPEAAVALSRTGPTAGLIGMLPGEVADGAEMPTVSGPAVAALAAEMAAELDAVAMRENGLQAIVAAALSNASIPLAISLRDSLIAKPLRQCVQCTLLWGLLRATKPVLGAAGRGWSFSTFELPLGDTDSAGLPGIVFRRAQASPAASAVNWRKELKVRPLAPDALAGSVPYADRVELAGWLVDEYQDRGGDDLAEFLADACGSERSLQGRLEQLQGKLRDRHGVVIISPESTHVTLRTGRSARAAEPGELSRSAAEPAPGLPPAPEFPPVPEEPEKPEETVLAEVAEAVNEPGGLAGPAPEVVAPEPGPASRQIAGINPGDWDRDADADQTVRANHYWYRTWTVEEVVPHRDARDAPDLPLSDRTGNPQWPSPPPSGQGSRTQGGESAYAGPQPHADRLPPVGRPPYEQAEQPYPPGPYPREQPSYPPGQPYAQPGRPHYQQGAAAQHTQVQDTQQPGSRAQPNRTVSSLLKQLELVGSDPGRFRACLEAIFSLRDVDDPGDRVKSWELISGKSWFRNVSKCELFQQRELAGIFSIVLIPELRRGGVREEAIAHWASEVPDEMIAGLLAAVREAEDQRPVVHAILEPVLAARWAREKLMEDLWDKTWPEAAARADRGNDRGRLRDIVRLPRKRR